MASIKFIPVCSSCGKIIVDKIDVAKEEIHFNSDKHYAAYNQYVHPSMCCNCGAHFDSIEIPTTLPFDNSNFVCDLIYETTKHYCETHPIQLSRIHESENIIDTIIHDAVDNVVRKITSNEMFSKEVK